MGDLEIVLSRQAEYQIELDKGWGSVGPGHFHFCL